MPIIPIPIGNKIVRFEEIAVVIGANNSAVSIVNSSFLKKYFQEFI
jgi:hypothetical protein